MIAKWPAERLRSFDRFSKMMEDIIGGGNDVWTPVVDVKETPKELLFIAELPGMKEKDVSVELCGDVLTIRGSREFNQEETKDDYVRIERNYGTFQRSFTIDIPVKDDAVKAVFKDGLLSVTVPKTEDRPARKIPIKAS